MPTWAWRLSSCPATRTALSATCSRAMCCRAWSTGPCCREQPEPGRRRALGTQLAGAARDERRGHGDGLDGPCRVSEPGAEQVDGGPAYLSRTLGDHRQARSPAAAPWCAVRPTAP